MPIGNREVSSQSAHPFDNISGAQLKHRYGHAFSDPAFLASLDPLQQRVVKQVHEKGKELSELRGIRVLGSEERPRKVPASYIYATAVLRHKLSHLPQEPTVKHFTTIKDMHRWIFTPAERNVILAYTQLPYATAKHAADHETKNFQILSSKKTVDFHTRMIIKKLDLAGAPDNYWNAITNHAEKELMRKFFIKGKRPAHAGGYADFSETEKIVFQKLLAENLPPKKAAEHLPRGEKKRTVDFHLANMRVKLENAILSVTPSKRSFAEEFYLTSRQSRKRKPSA